MNLHDRLIYLVADARRQVDRSDVYPLEVKRALLTTLGIPAMGGFSGHAPVTGYAGVLERHWPSRSDRSEMDFCASCGDPWPCHDVRNVQRTLSELGFPAHS